MKAKADAPDDSSPQARLQRVLDFLQSGDAAKQLNPPGEDKPNRRRKP